MTDRPTILTTVTETVVSAVRQGVSYLTDLLGRILRAGLQVAMPVMVGAGCSTEPVNAAVGTAASHHAVDRPPAPVEDAEPVPLGHFKMTFYYVVGEDEVAARAAARAAKQAASSTSDDPVGELAAITIPEMVTLYDGDTCEPIAEVSKEFAAQLALQGTGKLKDGRLLNVWGPCGCERSPCFKVTTAKWGTAGNGRALQPFRTVAVDPRIIKLGSLLHVPALEGRTMPGRAPWGGFVHDGCVVADDVGGGIKDHQLDLFVGKKSGYHGFSESRGSHAWARHVPVYDGSKLCERKGRVVSRKSGAI